jgi:hypothetical protein
MLEDLRFEKMVSQTRQRRGRIFSEQVKSNLEEIGRMVDCWQPVEVFNGSEVMVATFGRGWGTCGSRRWCRRHDSYVAVFFLSV